LNLSSHGFSQVPEEIWESQTAQIDQSFERSDYNAPFDVMELKRMVMADNQITALDSRLNEMISLAVLDARNNLIKHLPNLAGLVQLTVLNVSQNQLETIDPSVYLLPLMELRLDGNLLSDVGDLGKLTRLSILDLSKNKLTALPAGLDCLFSLTNLNLSYNGLETIDCSILDKPLLSELNLSYNRIKDFTQSCPLLLPKLKILDLKHNSLSKLRLTLNAPSLKDFCCLANNISEISGILDNSPELEILVLSDNSLASLPPQVTSLKTLKRLDISNNDIVKWTNIVCLASRTRITQLERSFIFRKPPARNAFDYQHSARSPVSQK
jgi:Leucine-rich repeat (LRR) protein